MSLIIKAAQFAARCHENQTRKYSGFPYITHPARVAWRAVTHDLATDELIAAAWLHDVVEDCGVTCDTLNTEFGNEVASLVMWLTNPSKGSKQPRSERKQMDREHIARAPREARVLKLLDRIDNLSEMDPTDSFLVVYCTESVLLLDALRGTDGDLERELEGLITKLMAQRKPAEV